MFDTTQTQARGIIGVIMISFIIPFKVTKGSVKLLARCLNSLCTILGNDTFEVIVVSDRDIPLEVSVLKSAKIYTLENSSLYEAVNYGIKYSSNDYYMMLGADDVFIGSGEQILALCSVLKGCDLDFLSFSVLGDAQVIDVNRGLVWLRGERALISNHSCGVISQSTYTVLLAFTIQSYELQLILL